MDELWDRVSGTQPVPPAWVIAVSGTIALLIVLNRRAWRLARTSITIAHEGGHALASVLCGRRLDGIRLHSDTSGVTYSRGRRTGPAVVLTSVAGYVTPSLLGAGRPGCWLRTT
jgi:Peptidase M50B-like